MVANNVTPVPFSFFVSLCRELSRIEPRPIARRTGGINSQHEPTSVSIFRRWVNEFRRRFPRAPRNTTVILFLLLFPEEDIDRKFGMQEASMTKALAGIFGFPENSEARASLTKWRDSSSLGEQIRKLLSRLTASNSTDEHDRSGLTTEDISSMLDELASTSRFSASCIRERDVSSGRTRQAILKNVFCRLSSFGVAVLTQIILKDLRPVLYPIPNTSPTESLMDFNSNSIHMITLQEAMKVWDPSGALLRCYNVQSTLQHSIRLFEEGAVISPQVGVPIQVPKCVKGQGCKDALAKFKSPTSIWAEIKYDGERMQIHISASDDGSSSITIFSKSGRDSTLDRIATHWIIREVLSLPPNRPDEVIRRAQGRASRQIFVSSAILDAEMVAYKEDFGIDEFWRIRGLVESTASGPRRKRRGDQLNESDASRHLALVFFDVLYLNGTSLLSEPYCSRRATLEAIIHPIPMYAFLASRTELFLPSTKRFGQCLEDLTRLFSSSLEAREEGLILKASNSCYGAWRRPWVKLKKDYIPGLGDALDLVLIGAFWEKERGRTLHVPSTTYTTFYVGAFANETVTRSSIPHLEVLFSVSYGLDRRQLEELNLLINSLGTIQYRKDIQEHLPFTFNLTNDVSEPTAIVKRPLLVEVFGAGFTKTAETKHYELRFPRVSKVHRPNDRSWLEAATLTEYDSAAHDCISKCSNVALDGKNISSGPKGYPPAVSENWSKEQSWADQGLAREKKRRRTREYARFTAISDRAEYPRLVNITRRSGSDARAPFNSLANCLSGLSPSCGGAIVESAINAGRDGSADPLSNNRGRLTDKVITEPSRHPFAYFLSKAVILMDCDLRSQDHDLAFVNEFLVPFVVHSREAFALGCARRNAIHCGIVFVDEASAMLWREGLPFTRQPSFAGQDRPIFVFSTDSLSHQALYGGGMYDELTIKAKCLAAYL